MRQSATSELVGTSSAPVTPRPGTSSSMAAFRPRCCRTAEALWRSPHVSRRAPSDDERGAGRSARWLVQDPSADLRQPAPAPGVWSVGSSRQRQQCRVAPATSRTPHQPSRDTSLECARHGCDDVDRQRTSATEMKFRNSARRVRREGRAREFHRAPPTPALETMGDLQGSRRVMKARRSRPRGPRKATTRGARRGSRVRSA